MVDCQTVADQEEFINDNIYPFFVFDRINKSFLHTSRLIRDKFSKNTKQKCKRCRYIQKRFLNKIVLSLEEKEWNQTESEYLENPYQISSFHQRKQTNVANIINGIEDTKLPTYFDKNLDVLAAIPFR